MKVVPLDQIRAAMRAHQRITPRRDGEFRADQTRRVQQGDLRDMVRLACACGYEWWAPRAGGCPTCRHAGPHRELERKMIGVPRS